MELLEGRLEEVRRIAVLGEIATCSDCRELFRDCLVMSSGGGPAGALPDELAGYRLGEVLGAGGGGIVVKAHDPVLARDVALKLMRTDSALNEARTLATIRHPAVVQVYAAGTIDHLGYVAMELVDGTSLAARLEHGPIEWKHAVRWFAEVTAGLGAIHAAGLVHRDVKPGNLLIDGDRLRIADFGLAARAPEAALAGTLPYLAPEVLAGAAADVRSDLYGLFVSLFEAVNGERPYREHDRRALRAAAEHGKPVWTRRVPAAVKRVVERGLAGDPEDRYRDAGDAGAALLGLTRPRRFVLVGVAALVTLAALAAFRAKTPACSLAAPTWAHVPASMQPQLARYGEQLVTQACEVPTTRACVASLDARVSTLLSSGLREVDLQRAIPDLPDPSTCTARVMSPLESASLASAHALLARAEPRQALIQVAIIASPDADLVRARAQLELGHDAAAIAAYRRVLESGARDELAVAANNGLAIAIGLHQHQLAAGEAYATMARQLAQTLGDHRAAGVARSTIGSLASQQGDAPRAVRELTGAIAELADAPLPRSAAELALAGVLRTKGDYAAARAHVEDAFTLRRDVLGADHPDTISVDLDRANIDASDGKAPHAVELLRGVVARLDAAYGPNGIELARPLGSLGRALASAGDFPAADATLARALAIDRAQRGELDRDTGQAYANLAQIRVVRGMYDEAIELYRKGLASVRSVTGEGHPDLASIYYGLGIALGSAQRYDEAREAHGHAIEIYRAHPGHDDELGRALAVRALIEMGLQRLPEAQRDANDALATLTQLHGADHPALLPALSAVAQCDLTANELVPARAAIERALAIHARIHATPRQYVEDQVTLAQILLHQGHRAEGLATAKLALTNLGSADPPLRTRIETWMKHPG